MKNYQKRSMILPVFCLLLSGPLAASEYFRIDPLTDSLLLGGGLLFNAGDIAIEELSEPTGGWTFDTALVIPPDISTVNPFDRLCVLPYSGPFAAASDIFTYAALLAPALLVAAPASEWIAIGTMYAEAVIWTWGLKELSKNLIHRNRPYLFFDGYPQDEITSGDFQQSFPSGHTSLAFTGAGFCSFVFSRYFEDSPWRIPVIAASYSLAFASTVMRAASGNHFLTDVIAGAALGSFTGLVVPWLHTLNIKPGNRSYSVSIAPTGINVKFSF